MPNAAQVKFAEIDQSFSVESLVKGIAGVLLKTPRGKYGMGESIITSWSQFKKEYGDVGVGFDGVIVAKRALERGAMLRVYKVGHYTTIANPATLDAVKSTINESVTPFAVDGTDECFDLVMKYEGADYNNLQIVIANASNGDTDSFNLQINHLIEPDLNELYENIKIVGKPTIANSHFLDEVISKSKFMTVVYKDISSYVAAAPFRPVNGTWTTRNGTNGSALVDADYAGDSAGKTGFYGFGDYDDFEVLASLDNFNNAVHVAGAAYAAQREDFIYMASINYSNVTVSAVNTARATTLVDSRFTQFWTGGIKIPNPFITDNSTNPYSISEIGDVIGCAMKSSAEFGPWYSFAEKQRGLIYNALGVVNNFGPNIADLNLLAQRQVNAVVNKNGVIYLTGNYSAQLASSRKSFINVVRLIIFMKKSLRPILDRFLGQPLDFRTMREIFNEVTPFLDSLVGNEKRALIEYEWRGDQFANRDSDLKVNSRAELDKGNYVAELYSKEAVALNQLLMRIISTPSGTTFEDNLN